MASASPSEDLLSALAFSLATKSGTPSSGSIAYTESGNTYGAGSVSTGTHVLDIPSELAALVRAAQANDVRVTRIETLSDERTVSPLVLKILFDHALRTGVPLQYVRYAPDGSIVFEARDVRTALPWYTPQQPHIPSLSGRTPIRSVTSYDPAVPVPKALREAALAGRTRNFPTYEGASGYGAALLTESGKMYQGGQYSSFDHRLGVHAEMGVVMSALMEGETGPMRLGVISSKFPRTPCTVCGCCLQFIAELARAYHTEISFFLFAMESDAVEEHSLAELLPLQWSNLR